MSTTVEVSSDDIINVNTSSTEVVVVDVKPVDVVVIETPAKQGPAGRDTALVSNKPNNRLTKEADGLYVKDDLSPDPLAYYILAKN